MSVLLFNEGPSVLRIRSPSCGLRCISRVLLPHLSDHALLNAQRSSVPLSACLEGSSFPQIRPSLMRFAVRLARALSASDHPSWSWLNCLLHCFTRHDACSAPLSELLYRCPSKRDVVRARLVDRCKPLKQRSAGSLLACIRVVSERGDSFAICSIRRQPQA